jgi:hypothetical protein
MEISFFVILGTTKTLDKSSELLGTRVEMKLV